MRIRELTDYRDNGSISQSFLKGVLANRISRPPSLQTLLGSFTDCLITTPELVDEIYVVDDIKLSDKEYEIILKIVEYGDWNIYAIHNALNEIGYYNNRAKLDPNEDKRVEEFLKFEPIFNTLHSGKQYISTEKRDEATNIANYLFTDKKTRECFEDAEFQKILYWEYDNEPCKGLLDIYKEKNGYGRVIDLKITDSTHREFKKIARRFRYEFQLSWYYEGISILTQVHQLPPILLVYSTQDKYAELYEMTDLDLHIGKYGAERRKSIVELIETGNSYNEVEFIYGWNDALQIYKQCKQLGMTDYNLTKTLSGTTPLNVWL